MTADPAAKIVGPGSGEVPEHGVDQGIDPRTGLPVGPPVPHTPPARLDAVCAAAAGAAAGYARMPLPDRAALLRAIGAALEAEREPLVRLADAETGLGPVRLGGELTRTQVQLEMFADAVSEGSFLDVIIDLPDPSARPAPRPDLRRMLLPVGPVAVFAASNFPFAFSVAGGDTASALAAGCPVVVKAHPGHPGLSVRCGQIVGAAVASAGAPPGTFAVVHGEAVGRSLVQHPATRAVGFTGSPGAGRALFDLCCARPDPIPFHGELGALNPVVVTSAALAERAPEIVSGFVASFTLGSGQFCTKPGLLLLPAGHGLDDALADATRRVRLGPLLGERIRARYTESIGRLTALPGVRAIVAPERGGPDVAPALLAVSAADLTGAGELLDECFGPSSVVVEYDSTDELLAAVAAVPGSLTATLHAALPTDEDLCRTLLETLAARAGRVVWGGWPTGVAVTSAMHHGGPWPATTASAHTSVGTTAVRRWLRPVVFQDVPDPLLPAELRDANPMRLPRRVNDAGASTRATPATTHDADGHDTHDADGHGTRGGDGHGALAGAGTTGTPAVAPGAGSADRSSEA